MRYHSSSMETYERCQRKFYLQSTIPRAEGGSVHLVAGAAFAKALETARKAFYVDGKDEDTALGLANAAMADAWGPDKMAHAGTAKNIGAMLRALDKYLGHFPLTYEEYVPYKIQIESNVSFDLAIEHKMRATLPNGEAYDGTPDMICEYSGLLWCLDDKTTGGRLDDTWRTSWLRRGQFLGYAWLAKQQYGIDVAGTIVRGVSITRSAISVAETFIPSPAHMIEEWVATTVSIIDEQKRKQEYANYRPSLGVSCNAYNSPCEFLDRCLGKQEA